MEKKEGLETSTEGFLLNALPKEELLRLSSKIKEILQKRYGITEEKQGKQIPLNVFSGKLSPAEALVKYMKENMEMNFHDIGSELCRDERGIWGSYNRARKKMPEQFRFEKVDVSLPLEIFADRTKSVLESVLVYLVETAKMKFSKIAEKLNKNYSTVYTTYLRAKKKAGQSAGKRKTATKNKGGEADE